jgi:hypothetical protein
MRIIKTKVYTFDELSDEAKEMAVQEYANINLYFDWWEGTFEDAEQVGIKLTEFDIDRRYCHGEFIEDAENIARLILEKHGDRCETYKDAWEFQNAVSVQGSIFMDRDDDEEFRDSDQYNELCEVFQRIVLEDYWLLLQKEYEYRISEEAIIEGIEANEYEFTEDGKKY